MILKYYGHSFFTLITEQGGIIAADPYGDFYQYPKRQLKADVCTVSHHHHDHDGLGSFASRPLVIDTPGVHTLADGVKAIGLPFVHDHHGGARRGGNILFVFELEGLRIAHCGDLGQVPDEALQKALGRLDVLLVPVGGYYTIGAAEAVETMKLLKPTVTVPMHYRTPYDPEMPIETAEGFLKLTKAEDATPASLLRLTAKDIDQRGGVTPMAIVP